MFAAMDDVAGEAAETEGEFAAEVEKGAEEDEQAAEEEKRAAEFAKGIHEGIIEEKSSRHAPLKLRWTPPTSSTALFAFAVERRRIVVIIQPYRWPLASGTRAGHNLGSMLGA